MEANDRAALAIAAYLPARTNEEDRELQTKMDQIRRLVVEETLADMSTYAEEMKLHSTTDKEK
jgi:hypothetical protein